jgi:type II secretory pathway predicted ATPase ExeA
MYPQFFGFDKLPFRLRPDAEFLYSSQEYRQARAEVLASLRGSARVILLLGRPGVGKTLLLDDVLREVAGQFNACRVNQPHIAATELLQALLMQLGTTTAEGESNHARLLLALTAVLNAAGARGAARPLLIIDDAQLLGGATLHTLGELLADAPRLKILLVGQDDPEQRGADLAAGMAVAQKPRQVRLPHLNADGTKAYVEHRLRVAGGGGKELFSADAYKMIFRHTGGTARLINVLCDAALHAACLRASGQVGAAEILAATQDSRWPEAVAREKARPNPPPQEDQESAQVLPPSEDSPPSQDSARDLVPLRAQLVVSFRKEPVATWPLKPGRISIGRANDNDLRLDAPFVSRHHCQIVTAGNVSTIEDLGSVNGMTVNGKAVKNHVLKNADEVMIGEHVLTYMVK